MAHGVTWVGSTYYSSYLEELALCLWTLGDERHWYVITGPRKLGIMALRRDALTPLACEKQPLTPASY